jgi:hypothetical protein
MRPARHTLTERNTMTPALALLATYLVVTIVLQVVGFFVSRAVGYFDPTISLMTFLVLFMGMFWAGWPIAVRIVDRLVPETERERNVRIGA